jgi:hypothetical protein
VILFGGTRHHTPWRPGVLLGDTWHYDGANWRQLQPATSPPPTVVAWLGADYTTGGLLLVATGTGSTVTTWLFDGTTWAAAGAGPAIDWGAAFASDPRRRCVWVVGQQPIWGGGQTTTTFSWDGTSWTTHVPAVVPPARRGAAAWFLWRWDGVAWTPEPGPTPPHTFVAAATYDANLGVARVAGRSQDGTVTAAWDGTSWLDAIESPGVTPLAGRTRFDGNLGAPACLPGDRATIARWDGFSWYESSLPAGVAPSGAVFDPVQRHTVLVEYVPLDAPRTHTWNGSTWTSQQSGELPAFGTIAFDPSAGAVAMLLGPAGMWHWRHGVWVRTAAAGPMPMSPCDVAADPVRGELMVFGGNTSGPMTTYVWNGAGWVSHPVTPSMPPRIEASLTFDSRRGRIVLFGGRSRTGNADWLHCDDTWEWDGANWTPVTLLIRPPARCQATLLDDPLRQRVQLLGGLRVDPSTVLWFADAWLLDSTPRANVTTLGPGCGGTNGIPRLVAGAPTPARGPSTLDVFDARPLAPVRFALSFTHQQAALGPCTSFVPRPDWLGVATADAAGTAHTGAPLPAALLGLDLAAQAAAFDPSAPLGAALTAGLRIRCGR